MSGCGRRHRSLGYCENHYDLFKRNGDPTVRQHAAKGSGSIDRHGYLRVVTQDGRRDLEHRVVMERRLCRRLRPEETVHHKNGDRLDNADDNLELWSSRHPKGQRVSDKLAWAKELIELYEPTPEWVGGGC